MDARQATLRVAVVSDPQEIARANAQRARFERNSRWLQSHVPEIYSQHRGKCICVAGEELFVGETPHGALADARAAHPDDDGALLRYIPLRKTARIYNAS
jgi:hypothetical protein